MSLLILKEEIVNVMFFVIVVELLKMWIVFLGNVIEIFEFFNMFYLVRGFKV